jgi:hypothetical protein
MDRLEEYIRKNREELDRYDLSPEIWNGMRKELHGKRSHRFRWLPAAAMIVVVFTTAALFYVYQRDSDPSSPVRDTGLLLMKANPQLMETELYYNNLVSTLYSEATPLLSGHPDIEKELIYDLSQIDSICADIKKDLRDNVANQEVIEALINNYRIKTHILEDMLELLKQDENNPVNINNHEL